MGSVAQIKLRWIFPLLLLVAAPALRAASTLDSSVIAMFPKDVSQLGYADLAAARQFSWYAQFEAQLVPVSLYSFEQFLEVAQMQQSSSIDRVAWARVNRKSADSPSLSGPPTPVDGGGQLVAVAGGHFDLDAIKEFLDAHKVPAAQVGNDSVYASGTNDVFFAIIDDETIAFGPLNELTRLLQIRRGDEESLLANQPMMDLIAQANGDSIFWGVLGSQSAGPALQQLVPEAAKFPQAAALFGKISEVLVTLKASGDYQLNFTGATSSPNDAMLLSQLLQAGILYRQYQATESNPALAQLLGGISISPSGADLQLSLTLTDDQLLSLVEHNTFTQNTPQ